MRISTFLHLRISRKFLVAVLGLLAANLPVFAQISFDDESGRKADSRKIRREAARYKAEDVKESHLDMKKYSYKRGAFGNRPESEELAKDEIYYGPNPIKNDRRFLKKKR